MVDRVVVSVQGLQMPRPFIAFSRRALSTALLLALVASLSACGNDDDETADDEKSGGPPMEAAERIESCLRSSGFRTQLLPVGPGDEDAPDVGIAYQRGRDSRSGGEVAVYESEAEASSKFPAIETTLESAGGLAERHGVITVVFFAKPPRMIRDDVDACVARGDAD
jgi:hypothetical protein